MEKRERDIEKWLRRQIERAGGRFMKFISPGNDGAPDRIAIMPGGRIWFVELKKDGERPAPKQVWQIDRLQKLGCQVTVLAGQRQAEDWVREVMSDEVHTL